MHGEISHPDVLEDAEDITVISREGHIDEEDAGESYLGPSTNPPVHQVYCLHEPWKVVVFRRQA